VDVPVTPAPTSTTVAASSSTTAAPATTAAPRTTTTQVGPPDTGDVEGFDVATIAVAGEELAVAVADDRGSRRQGLRAVEDLGDLAGMLFVWDEDVRSSFTMADTLIDLDIAFLDADGVVVDTLEMVVCTPASCPAYGTFTSYRYALESPLGALGLSVGDVVGLP
jgi:uncharacterized membrane protein (UPF0127 family)